MNKEGQPQHIITQFTRRDLIQLSEQLKQILTGSIRQGHSSLYGLQSFIDQTIPDPRIRSRLLIAAMVMDSLKGLDVNIDNVKTVLVWGPSDLTSSMLSWDTPPTDLRIEVKRVGDLTR